MTSLHEAIGRAKSVAAAGYAKPPTTPPEIQQQLRGLDEGVGRPEPNEDLIPFLRRARELGVARLGRPDVNRVLRGAWHDESFDVFGVDVIQHVEADVRRSSDQALIEGYLVYFPVERSVIIPLAAAVGRAANRHVWAWRDRSARWSLFDQEAGPKAVGQGIVSAEDDPWAVLASAGLGQDLAATGFGRSSFVEACARIRGMTAERAESAQRRLLDLFDADQLSAALPNLVQALLEPWVETKPQPDHRKLISGFLLDQAGDPRIHPQRWKHIQDTISDQEGLDRASVIVGVLRRWLTDVAMREFFNAIAKTTDRPDQWKQRSDFWLAYLDVGLVSDAWLALGVRARGQIEQLFRQQGERPEFGIMVGGPPASSSIIMQIGDLRISEWSDNGSCRFWSDDDKSAPKLFSKKYDGTRLRTTTGQEDFEYYSHLPSPGWEPKFAGVIHRRTGILHPQWGRGRGRYWNETW